MLNLWENSFYTTQWALNAQNVHMSESEGQSDQLAHKLTTTIPPHTTVDAGLQAELHVVCGMSPGPPGPKLFEF